MKSIFLNVCLLLSLSGCAGTTWWPDIDSEKKCEDVKGLSLAAKNLKWNAEGHVSTTDIIALAAGQQKLAEKYALYSQVPDAQALRFSAPAVSIWGVFNWEYRQNINSILHSLHGGDEKKVYERRNKLSKLINQLVREDPEKNAWKIGYLIHALGDSFAHVYDEGNGLYAYGPGIGHLCEKGSFSPDSIYENNKNYLAYLKALFDALDTGNGDTGILNRYVTHVNYIIKQAGKLAESERKKYIRENIVKFELANIPPLHYCDHKKWADEVTFKKVKVFLQDIKKSL